MSRVSRYIIGSVGKRGPSEVENIGQANYNDNWKSISIGLGNPSCSSIGNGFFLSLFIFIILFWRFFDEIESSRVDMGSMIRVGQRAGGVKRSSPLGHPFNFLVKLRSSKNIVYSKKLSFVIVQKQGPSFPMNQINTFTRMKEWQNSRHAMPG